MDIDEMRRRMKEAAEDVKKDPSSYKGVADEMDALGEEPGPYFGPRNDIERRKLLNEIEESGKYDDEDN